MKSSLRAFGIGLFVAGAAITITDKLDLLDSSLTISEVNEYKEKITSLEQQLADMDPGAIDTDLADVPKEDVMAEDDSTTQPAEQPVGDVHTATVYIYENMSIYEIGQIIEDEGIVMNGREVELYLSKPEYARSIQKGAFDLRSDMTIEQIAKTVTGKKLEQ